jgi:hypothetical protein
MASALITGMTPGPQVLGSSLLEESPCLSLHVHRGMLSLPVPSMKGHGRVLLRFPPGLDVPAKDRKEGGHQRLYCLSFASFLNNPLSKASGVTGFGDPGVLLLQLP